MKILSTFSRSPFFTNPLGFPVLNDASHMRCAMVIVKVSQCMCCSYWWVLMSNSAYVWVWGSASLWVCVKILSGVFNMLMYLKYSYQQRWVNCNTLTPSSRSTRTHHYPTHTDVVSLCVRLNEGKGVLCQETIAPVAPPTLNISCALPVAAQWNVFSGVTIPYIDISNCRQCMWLLKKLNYSIRSGNKYFCYYCFSSLVGVKVFYFQNLLDWVFSDAILRIDISF